VILVSRTIDDVPFDLRHERVIVYEYTPPGMKQFEAALREALQRRRHSTLGQISPVAFERRAVEEGLDAMENCPERSFPPRLSAAVDKR